MFHLLFEILANATYANGIAPLGQKVLKEIGVKVEESHPLAMFVGFVIWVILIGGSIGFVIWIFSK